MMYPHGTLYLMPTPLGDLPPALCLPPAALALLATVRHFVVEEPKTARKFLKDAGMGVPIASLTMHTLNEHTAPKEVAALLTPLYGNASMAGHDVIVLSEAGCPAVADPGAPLVRLAHEQGIRVVPLVGPSSIMLALMASGCSGQRFAFHGYLPVNDTGRVQALQSLEKRSRLNDETQLFIETPYRNLALLETLKNTLAADTWLVTATHLTLPDEQIVAKTVYHWRKMDAPAIHKKPTLFLFGAK